MPNWVKTKIMFCDISDEKFEEIVELFTTKATNKNGYYTDIIPDFEKIIPMPDDIYKGNLGREEELIYGKKNWYDWSCENWGTKWNAHYGSIDEFEHAFLFETAWSFAAPVICELAIKAECDIDAIYADEDLGRNCGHFFFEKNGDVEDYNIEEDSDAAWEIIEELWGVSREEREGCE